LKERLRAAVGPILVLLLLIAALWMLHHELKDYHLRDFVRSFTQIPAYKVALAIGLTCVSYAVLIGYDALGLYYLNHVLSWPKIATASLLSYAVGNSFGTLLGGSTVRLRLYTSWGLSAVEIVRLSIILSITFWTGLFALAGVLFLIHPLPIPARFQLPMMSSAPLGLLFGALALAFLALCAIWRKPIRWRDWEFSLPPPRIAALQFLIAAVDLLIAATVLWVLTPASLELPLVHFLSAYVLALALAVLSHSPGGLGVFELALLVLLAPERPDELMGALLAYRVVYYLVPLGIALIAMAVAEALPHREKIGKAITHVSRWSTFMAPRFLSFAIFVCGAVLLFSDAMPIDKLRMEWIKEVLPLPLVELSHLLGSVVGVLLLLLARALMRRIETAYYVAIGLLLLGVLFSLLKGFAWEEAILLGSILLLFLPCRRHFYRKGAIFVRRYSLAWFIAVSLVLACALWLMQFAYKHVEYKNQLWWQFTLEDDAPRSLRALATAVVVTLVFSASRLLSSRPPLPSRPSAEEFSLARKLVEKCPRTSSNLALLGDKFFLFNEAKTAFLMYGVEGKCWICMGDPIGDESAYRELLWLFRERCDEGGRWPVFYQVDAEYLPIYVEMGLTLVKLGEDARVPIDQFSLEGSSRKVLRRRNKQLSEAGCEMEIVSAPLTDALLADLKRISDDWLSEKNAAEKGFSLGFFQPDYLRSQPVALLRHHGRTVAFANLWCGGDKEELSIDLMRYTKDAPPGAMEFLFIKLMIWGREQGYRWFNLGMAPLSGVDSHRLGPIWNRVAALAFRHGEHFYNFQGLRQYKDKFDPQWSPKYLASRGGAALPVILVNLTALIAGGLTRILRK
jgi:phosphatidylglycerol lysyltransferase